MSTGIVLLMLYISTQMTANLFLPMMSKIHFNIRQVMKYDINYDLFSRLLKHDVNYFNTKMSGSLSSKIDSVSCSICWCLKGGEFNGIITFCILLGIFFVVNVYLAVFSLIWMLISLYFFIIVFKRIINNSKSIGEEKSKANGIIIDCFSNIGNIKAFSTEDRENRFLRRQICTILRNQKTMMKTATLFEMVAYVFTSVLTAVCLLTFYYEYLSGSLTLGRFIFLFQVVNTTIFWIIGSMFSITHSIRRFGRIKNGLDTLLIEPKIVDFGNTKNINDIKGLITFKNIDFSYDEKS